MRSNVQIIQAHYDASVRGDITGMTADVSPAARWTEMSGFPCAGTWIGPDEVVRNVFQVLGRDWTGYRFTLDRLVDGGDEIVGVGTYSGTFKATGLAMSARVVHVWGLEHGRIVRFEQFTDTLLVARAMSS